ncbi:hypothetical protein CHGG_10592 [Chaetomium globosum CBS 148.51]|uniref:Protein kinase domain-containing protein n=1 Tax=Chaetomium globosum (strain ATCC 6205 / CBS 148.51 / DSM 1962 / NBRC 6347 / NRRL 1970) TaxID=306901 RepID=Q2GN62_CHAGB|nr:uncharacterized protein CHGG_10592 [Chaetomium globosum CBS 148.51]EAQ84188.1 hypothetical protein CHGG_10592 [Chaetomium globosum CBS 148.51]
MRLEERWWSIPFGWAVVVDFLEVVAGEGDGVGRVEEEVALVPGYGVEQGMVDWQGLRAMWEGEVDWEGVEVVEWERLRFKRQVHEVISVVEVAGLAEGKEVVFKSVLQQQEQRYMYNELKMLLSLGSHPNLIARPLGVVTKKGRFGNRRGVCGFLLEWFPLGSLKERLLRDDYEEITSMEQKLKWAAEVTEAFIHINGHSNAGFYPDLKPDNIVLRQDAKTGMLAAVLIDLEQRGGWFAWSPPEVAYVEYLEILADESGLAEGDLKDVILEELREYYGDPEWSPDTAGPRYHNTEGGFSAPWLALLEARKAEGWGMHLLERAQVFMLGKLLWCIFEGQPFVRCGIDHEVLRDGDPGYESRRSGKARAFPEFKKTPRAIRELIQTCTAGAPEWDTRHPRLPGVVLQGGKIHPVGSTGGQTPTMAVDTLNAAKRFWNREVELARSFMAELLLVRGNALESTTKGGSPTQGSAATPGLLDLVQTRPLFSEILEQLNRIASG